MRKISTLIYLVDDTTIPLESILYESVEQPTTNELLNSIFEFIEVDPGSELITRILEHLNEQG
jgi:hypothetical protein